MKKLSLCLVFALCTAAYAATPQEAVLSYARTGNETALKTAVKQDKLLLFTQDKHGNTLMITAAIHGQNVLIKYLNSVWPDWDKTNKYGETPLHAAIRFKHPATARLIVALIANNPDILLEKFINTADTARQQTPLHWAAQNCDRELYLFLVKWGANPSSRNKSGQTPPSLLAACPLPAPDKAG